MRLSTLERDEMVGSVLLGRYRVLRHLADGGMGSIYLARNEGAAGFVRPVVIKWILPQHSGDEKMTQLFMREARIMATLRHPGIVSVQDFALDDGMYIMVMEYVHGFHLGRWSHYMTEVRGGFPAELVVHIMLAVLRALDYAHKLTGDDKKPLGIVHRDVTPSNVLIDVDGHVKLADFGVARIASEHTAVGDESIKGKFQYLPPEIFEGVPASAVTDVYSAGVTLHEILVGHNEFASDSGMAASVGLAFHHTPTRVDTLRADVSSQLADVIEKALSKDPNDRYKSAAEFARALSRVRRLDEVEAAERVRMLAATDFRNPRMAEMSSLPQLAELESAWRTPTPTPRPAGKRRRGLTDDSLATAKTHPGDDTPSVGQDVDPFQAVDPTGPFLPVEPAKRSYTGLLVAAAVLAFLAVGGVAAYALWIAKEKPEAQAPSYIVMDERKPPGNQTPGTQPGTETPADNPDGSAQAGPGEADAGAAAKPVEDTGDKKPVSAETKLSRAFAKHKSKVTACFRSHRDDVGRSTKVSIRFEVEKSGKVSSATVFPSSVRGSGLGRCLKKVGMATRFGRQSRRLAFRVPLSARVE